MKVRRDYADLSEWGEEESTHVMDASELEAERRRRMKNPRLHGITPDVDPDPVRWTLGRAFAYTCVAMSWVGVLALAIWAATQRAEAASYCPEDWVNRVPFYCDVLAIEGERSPDLPAPEPESAPAFDPAIDQPPTPEQPSPRTPEGSEPQ